jgi:uncharacterized integral membrane protein (TIGR00697 family)
MNRTQVLFFLLGGFFITNALVAELIGGKLFVVDMPVFLQNLLPLFGIHNIKQFTLSLGLLPWPIVFVATDVVNEFFGRKGVRFYTFVTMGLILYVLVILQFGIWVEPASFSPVDQDTFVKVFGLSQRIILASVVAFGVSQLVDVLVFSKVRLKTGSKFLWARATGSTIVSQMVDTFLIGFLAFKLPGLLTTEQWLAVSTVSYIYKVGVAILITPLCYAGHRFVRWFVGEEEAARLIQQAHGKSLEHAQAA